jgi:peptidoglycan/xylan/chitin deacetylase (PgdA/CDA1 family)
MASGVSAQVSSKAFALDHAIFMYGGLERADTTEKNIYLSFTGGDFNDGGKWISRVLKKEEVPAHFFFTGDFYRLSENKKLLKQLIKQGHYLGPHSDKHLLYASWTNRDSLLVGKEEFTSDLINNYKEMAAFGIQKKEALFFMPPYEWYNQQISNWTAELGFILINYTPGTRSNADYTTPDMSDRYIGSKEIYESILNFESTSYTGLNGFILLIHIGTAPGRTDKFYYHLEDLLIELKNREYQFKQLTEFYNQ